ncbi:hypothetical protein T552_01948 [Pneumocystis carinii B80]|uniref:Phosphoglycerate mutase n=1 Tax=Pneumocystis carinii (strain B80) TaxID=1408658 RepID=A0A0W4ZI90_PNEC8|nr:hypothetical protein T552_01948 [Pneumocystis carinii B80]KTW28087.1 hypothetical protein T552_01948 [Pneumocystis carinii B80]
MAFHKEIYIMRHAQAEHNVNKDYNLKDPVLTEFGKDQARLLLLYYEQLKNVELIISSPMRRALETVMIGFDGFLDLKDQKHINYPSIPLIILPELQETSDRNCDTCSSLENLKSWFPSLDWSFCSQEQFIKTGFFAYEPSMLEKRAIWLRNWVSNRKENKILIVSHLSFIKYLVDDPTYWQNLEIKKYIIETDSIFKQVSFS